MKKRYYKTINYQKLFFITLKEKYFTLFLGMLVSFFISSFVYKSFLKSNLAKLFFSISIKKPSIPAIFKSTKKESIKQTKKPEIEKKYQTYVVQPGDSLSLIAEKFYGDLYAWPKILQANNLASPDNIEVGMTLNIPR